VQGPGFHPQNGKKKKRGIKCVSCRCNSNTEILVQVRDTYIVIGDKAIQTAEGIKYPKILIWCAAPRLFVSCTLVSVQYFPMGIKNANSFTSYFDLTKTFKFIDSHSNQQTAFNISDLSVHF
jgi:hypothetical protein